MSYLINIKFELSGVSTPLLPENFIFGAVSNPTSIEDGETVTLNFKADGMYFGFKNRKGASATGATLGWSVSENDATITLSDPTSDVEITIIAVVKVAPQIVSKPFLYQIQAPVDTRLVLTKKEMREANDNYLPETYFALCKDEGHFYLYNKNNEPNEETGKYTLISDAQTGLPEVFMLQDPAGDQVIIYDAELGKWINKDLADKESIIYLAERGLTIKGYESANQGDMLVKDAELGLTWVKPLTPTDLQNYVAAAYESAQQAGTYANNAAESAIKAETAKTQAQYINDATMAHVNDKFWWGTIEEYNALESINAGTFHFITLESTDVEE